ncbi:hypothetical protein F5144DRAFT_128798 [Chaetomium tenue]|uniref:Uncharacterized protein n=1 Tax=Chaetomium tenue TaxID=1854479 RepID=A0ACB7PKT3_9PEZI|nr:hypothetical protein F5144DRAFT_128798 [Chaetomium globosum]
MEGSRGADGHSVGIALGDNQMPGTESVEKSRKQLEEELDKEIKEELDKELEELSRRVGKSTIPELYDEVKKLATKVGRLEALATNVEKLDIEKLETLPTKVEKLEGLGKLDVEKLEALEKLDVEKLKALEKLDVEKLEALEKLDVEKLKVLEKLDVKKLKALEKLDVEKLEATVRELEEKLAKAETKTGEAWATNNKKLDDLLREVMLARQRRDMPGVSSKEKPASFFKRFFCGS